MLRSDHMQHVLLNFTFNSANFVYFGLDYMIYKEEIERKLESEIWWSWRFEKAKEGTEGDKDSTSEERESTDYRRGRSGLWIYLLTSLLHTFNI